MTYNTLLQWGEQQLQQARIPDGKWDAWLLFSHVYGIDRARYYMLANQEIEDVHAYKEMIHRRLQRIPLQHITGRQEFMGYEFCVNDKVLIPRQDTECLVEKVWQDIMKRKNMGQENIELLDMCTGSGCIAISLYKLYQEKYTSNKQEAHSGALSNQKKEPDRIRANPWEHKVSHGLQVTAVDVSAQALQVARENGLKMECEHIQWMQSDLFDELTTPKRRFDIIVSNPPYIPTDVIATLEEEVRLHDPMLALDGKENGLYFYEKIIKQSTDWMKENGVLAFEIGCEQKKAVMHLMEQSGYKQVESCKDLAGLDRVVMGRLI